jgi:hypothetical protein
MATNRLERFQSYKSHPWLKKAFAKLSGEERDLAESFIVAHDEESKAEFEHNLNRMFMDRFKPKNFTVILELLANANSGCEEEKL